MFNLLLVISYLHGLNQAFVGFFSPPFVLIVLFLMRPVKNVEINSLKFDFSKFFFDCFGKQKPWVMCCGACRLLIGVRGELQNPAACVSCR